MQRVLAHRGHRIFARRRRAETAEELDLIQAALTQCAGNSAAWFKVRDLATDKKLTDAQKNRWADVLLRLGVKRYPDFTLAILTPMIQTIDDPNQQDRLWGACCFRCFKIALIWRRRFG